VLVVGWPHPPSLLVFLNQMLDNMEGRRQQSKIFDLTSAHTCGVERFGFFSYTVKNIYIYILRAGRFFPELFWAGQLKIFISAYYDFASPHSTKHAVFVYDLM